MIMRGCQHLCKYVSTPENARRFVSQDTKQGLTPRDLKWAAENSGNTPSLSSGLSHLAGLLPIRQASELSWLVRRQLQQERQAIIRHGPWLQLIHEGRDLESSISDQKLRSSLNNSSFLGEIVGTSTTLPPRTASSSKSIVDAVKESQSSVTAFLSHRPLATDPFGGVGETANGVSPAS